MKTNNDGIINDLPRQSVLEIISQTKQDPEIRRVHKALKETEREQEPSVWKIAVLLVVAFLVLILLVGSQPARGGVIVSEVIVLYPPRGEQAVPIEVKKIKGDPEKKYANLVHHLIQAGFREVGGTHIKRKCEVEDAPDGYHVAGLVIVANLTAQYAYDWHVAKPQDVVAVCRTFATMPLPPRMVTKTVP